MISLLQRFPLVTRFRQDLYKFVKTTLGRLLIALSLQRVLFRNIAVIITFHRVSDKVSGDHMTCDPHEFRKYCLFFRRNFNVVSLGTIVEKLHRGEPFDCLLAMSLDDGYADNYEYAAPILRDLHLPATFFVITQFIGTDVIPWWDREAPVVHKWMTWDQVRSLHANGFEIGSHTRSHVNLSEVAVDIAVDEIAGSQKDLETQLGTPIHLFAYPYGSAEYISDEKRPIVQDSGYRCCCGYGFINTAESDPYHLGRISHHSLWYASPYHLIGDLAVSVLIKKLRSWSIKGKATAPPQ